MSIHSSHGIPASPEQAAECRRRVKDFHAREDAEREAELKESELRNIESRDRWAEIWAAMDLDDVIEIPCIEDGKIVMRRFHENGGKLLAVERDRVDRSDGRGTSPNSCNSDLNGSL